MGEGHLVDLHPGHRRIGRPRRADHADRRRPRRPLRARPAGRRRRTAHPDGGRRGGRDRGRLPHPAGRRAAGRRGALPRRLRVRRARSGGPRQRHGLLRRHLDLRRDDAVRAPGALPVRHQAPAALRPAGAAGVDAGRAVRDDLAGRSKDDRRAHHPAVGAPGPGRPGGRRLLRPHHRPRRLAAGAAGPGARPPRGRVWRRAGGDHRRQLAAARLDGRAAAVFSLPGQDHVVVADDRLGRQRRRLRPGAGDRRPLRRRLRPGRPAGAARPAHRSGRLCAGGDGDLLRRHRPHAAVVTGPGLRAGRKLRPARAAHAGRGDRLRRPAQAVALHRPGQEPARIARAQAGRHRRRADHHPGRRDHANDLGQRHPHRGARILRPRRRRSAHGGQDDAVQQAARDSGHRCGRPGDRSFGRGRRSPAVTSTPPSDPHPMRPGQPGRRPHRRRRRAHPKLRRNRRRAPGLPRPGVCSAAFRHILAGASPPFALGGSLGLPLRRIPPSDSAPFGLHLSGPLHR